MSPAPTGGPRRQSSDWHRATRPGGATSAASHPRTSAPRNYASLAKGRAALEPARPTAGGPRIRGELSRAGGGTRSYDEELAGVQLDLLLLGLGADGHIASLFPGSPQLRERERRVTCGQAGLEPFVERVTMTLPTLLSAGRIVLLVSGAPKAAALGRALGGPIGDELPASLLRAGQAPIDVFCDRDAAGSLEG